MCRATGLLPEELLPHVDQKSQEFILLKEELAKVPKKSAKK